MRIAVLFSPEAGGNSKYQRIGEILSKRLSSHEIFTCKGFCGEYYLPNAGLVSYDTADDYKSSIANMSEALIESAPELFICVGGDGLAAYVADTFTKMGSKTPLMGVAGGTANVGPITSVRPESLKYFDPMDLKLASAGAVRVKNGKIHIGYAFNDAVIGNTFLGTIDGNMTNLSVEALLNDNSKIAQTPSCDITTGDFKIYKNGKPKKFSISNPGQIIVSPLEVDNFYGRAITGALCFSAYLPQKAAIGLFDEVLINAGGNNTAPEQFAKAEHLLFGPGDQVSITGLSPKAHIVIDGNPYLRQEDIITFEYIPGLINIARPAANTV